MTTRGTIGSVEKIRDSGNKLSRGDEAKIKEMIKDDKREDK
mgnify:CR=1 FL=1